MRAADDDGWSFPNAPFLTCDVLSHFGAEHWDVVGAG